MDAVFKAFCSRAPPHRGASHHIASLRADAMQKLRLSASERPQRRRKAGGDRASVVRRGKSQVKTIVSPYVIVGYQRRQRASSPPALANLGDDLQVAFSIEHQLRAAFSEKHQDRRISHCQLTPPSSSPSWAAPSPAVSSAS